MTGIYIAIGVIALVAAIMVFNQIERLKRALESKQEDLEAQKEESIRKENRLLVSFTEQTTTFRKQIEAAEDELGYVKKQYEEMLHDQTALLGDRDKWKTEAEQATTENQGLKQTTASLAEESETLQQRLRSVEAERAQWVEKYQTERAQWDQQKKDLVGQLRTHTVSAPSLAEEPNHISKSLLKTREESSDILCEADDVWFTQEGMVLGERSTDHPDQLSNALLYEGVTTLNPLCAYSREETDSYPAIYRPENGVPTLTPVPLPKLSESPLITQLRQLLRKALEGKAHLQLLGPAALPIRNRSYGYVTPMALYVETGNFYVAIEVDAPYDLRTRQPLHPMQGADHLRNLYFMENGWVVYRLTEQQLVEQGEQMVALLLRQLSFLTNRTDLYVEASDETLQLPHWTPSQAEEWAQTKQRESYLPTEALTYLQSCAITAFTGQLPSIDILRDETARYEKLSQKLQAHPFTKISLRSRDYDYVFASGSAQVVCEGYERGWQVLDVIEEKRMFIPFSDVRQVSYLDNLWRYPECVVGEVLSMEDWEQMRERVKEAAYGTHPVQIHYQPTEGTEEVKTVLHLSHLFTQPNNGEVVAWEQAASLLFVPEYLKDDFQNFVGRCAQTQQSEAFNAYQIKRISLYDCHKPGVDYDATDFLGCLQADQPVIQRWLYESMSPEKQYQAGLLYQ